MGALRCFTLFNNPLSCNTINFEFLIPPCNIFCMLVLLLKHNQRIYMYIKQHEMLNHCVIYNMKKYFPPPVNVNRVILQMILESLSNDLTLIGTMYTEFIYILKVLACITLFLVWDNCRNIHCRKVYS